VIRIGLHVLLDASAWTAAGPSDPAPLVGTWPDAPAVYRPLSLRAVHLGGFLGRHVDASIRSLPAGLESPLPKGIEAITAGRQPPDSCRRLATDSDFYKWLEGACYAIAYDAGQAGLRATVERYADLLLKLQHPDGYLGTGINPAKPFDERVRHDLYIAGHFMEAAVAHFEATGSRKLLDAAVRLADFYLDAFHRQHPYYQLIGQEHPEIELALVRLYRATGEKRFLEFSADLTRLAVWGNTIADLRAGAGRRHAVRLCYQLTGAAELYLQKGDRRFLDHLPNLWDEIVTTRMYVTGGIGYNESIPEAPYDLPQTIATRENRDIAETCASVSLMMLSWRQHAITGESRCFDVIETILYNHYLGALSADHLGVFYYNPLKRVGDLGKRTDHGGNPVRRTRLPEIHSTACCMPNAWRFFGQLPEYVFSARGDGLAINLYTDAAAAHHLADGTPVRLEVQTGYPHEGEVRVTVNPDRPARFSLDLRIPGWCVGASVRVNDEPALPGEAGTSRRVEREWRAGDRVELHLPMRPVVRVDPPKIAANRDQVAFRRGPLVYCLERQDAAGLDLDKVSVHIDPSNPAGGIEAAFDPGLGLYVLKIRMHGEGADGGIDRDVRLIPFFHRANRDPDPRWITWIPQR
jgi:DUF1680 family protein